MSNFDDLAGGWSDMADAVAGERQSIKYRKPDSEDWNVLDAIAYDIRGTELYNEANRYVKRLTVNLDVPTIQLDRIKVTTIEANAQVQFRGAVWSIDVAESRWNPQHVRLGLMRELIQDESQVTTGATV